LIVLMAKTTYMRLFFFHELEVQNNYYLGLDITKNI
jgi:hypothetical protein